MTDPSLTVDLASLPRLQKKKDTMTLHALTASEVQRRIQANTLTLEEYVAALLARHQARDHDVRAWAYLDPETATESARRLDRLAPEERGSLHGFVIGVKDVINTKDFPTRHNSSYHAQDGAQIDASTVAILRANGALIMGMLFVRLLDRQPLTNISQARRRRPNLLPLAPVPAQRTLTI
jgi:hypothetical protein